MRLNYCYYMLKERNQRQVSADHIPCAFESTGCECTTKCHPVLPEADSSRRTYGVCRAECRPAGVQQKGLINTSNTDRIFCGKDAVSICEHLPNTAVSTFRKLLWRAANCLEIDMALFPEDSTPHQQFGENIKYHSQFHLIKKHKLQTMAGRWRSSTNVPPCAGP